MGSTKEIIIYLVYLLSSFLFIYGIKKLSHPVTARRGNMASAIGMLLAIVVTLFDKNIISYQYILAGLVLGSAIGAFIALKVEMTNMPQMVGVLNGFGGAASALVGISEYYLHLTDGLPIDIKLAITISLTLLIGGVTFTGSMIAFGKLQGIVSGKVISFPGQHVLNLLLLLGVVVLIVLAILNPANQLLFLIIAGIALLLGVLLVIPIGGADMPVAIALLNSYSGIAASMTGFVINNNMLIIAGALVGASGIILTNIMCKAMNRSLMNVLLGGWGQNESAGVESDGEQKIAKSIDNDELALLFEGAQRVIIIPGYGMAVAQAQHAVKELMDILQSKGIDVKFAIHPVAGRMPGHMNILLAESNVPYENMMALEEINDDFKNTDISLVIGANDVVNPDARNKPESPIYGMPILNADYSKTVIVNKRSLAVGYAGIENPLFFLDNTLMYFGDAKSAVTKLNNTLKEM